MDNLRRRRARKGGFVENQTEYEIAETPQNETPLQRFHRLQSEVKQFMQELADKKVTSCC